MTDWVEFGANGDTVAVRPSYITSFETQAMGYTKLWIDYGGNELQEVVVSEPYDQVKQKIFGAERWPDQNAAVGHFTRDEYKVLSIAVAILRNNYTTSGLMSDADKCKDLLDKLNEILKEE